MWFGILLLVFNVFPSRGSDAATVNQLCFKESPYAHKVRISLNAALGDEAYEWDENEQFYFQATMAYGMRKSMNKTFNVSDVHICQETSRISFYFVVTNETLQPVSKSDVEKAIRMVRSRFNNAFSLDDETLEFIGIEPTFAPVAEPSVKVWLIVFGVVMGLVIVALIVNIITGYRDRKKKARESEGGGEENEDKTLKGIENGIYCNSLVETQGRKNEAFCQDDDKLTKL
ncbi:collectrin [Rhincodon typus]|uniref:collectrin n=1 Tax=Rhincodon typus TaxID=259920 RepID=UPI00202EE50B|nr:collectrin [Rhincodon typus]